MLRLFFFLSLLLLLFSCARETYPDYAVQNTDPERPRYPLLTDSRILILTPDADEIFCHAKTN